MDTKLEITVEKTIEALARIQRFVAKYGSDLDNGQRDRISDKLQELQNKIRDL
jgi:PHP family Zn ribbon phosphoesterase